MSPVIEFQFVSAAAVGGVYRSGSVPYHCHTLNVRGGVGGGGGEGGNEKQGGRQMKIIEMGGLRTERCFAGRKKRRRGCVM